MEAEQERKPFIVQANLVIVARSAEEARNAVSQDLWTLRQKAIETGREHPFEPHLVMTQIVSIREY